MDNPTHLRSIAEIAASLDVGEGNVRNIIRARKIARADNTPTGQLLYDEGAVEIIRDSLWPSDPAAEHGRMDARSDSVGRL